MNTHTFLRLYVTAALIGAAGLWTVAASAVRESAGGFASESPERVVESCPSVPACGLLEPVAHSQGDLLTEIKYGMLFDAAGLCGVPRGIALGVAMAESRMIWPAVRRHEAAGYMQVKRAAARDVDARLRHETHAWDNMLAGLCYLRRMYDREGSWREALLSYRLGPYRNQTTQEAHDYTDGVLDAADMAGAQ